MTVGDIIDILEQFPRDQILEIGILDEKDPYNITCLAIADILISEKHIIIVDPDSSDLVQRIIGSKLNVRRTGKSDKGVEVGEAPAPCPAPPGNAQPPALSDNTTVPVLSDNHHAPPSVLHDGNEVPVESPEG